MNIIEKIKKIDDLNIISNNGASEEQILRAEKRLELKFPEEYKNYVKEFGAISFLGNEWTGLNIDGYFNVVNMTEEERALNEFFPKKYFVIENIGVDRMLIISNEKGEIYTIQYNKIKFLCNSLSEYLDICLEEN
jgi:hypothetical protein